MLGLIVLGLFAPEAVMEGWTEEQCVRKSGVMSGDQPVKVLEK